MDLPIEIDREQLATFCRKHHITMLALFGSVLTERFSPDSDVDVLFEYDPAHVPSLFDVAAMEEELSAILGRKADMRTPRDLSQYFRDEVLRTARRCYGISTQALGWQSSRNRRPAAELAKRSKSRPGGGN